MKFGGTSVANSEAISRTISIIRGRLDQKPVVVVSALAKVTDMLYSICDYAQKGDSVNAEMLLEQLKLRHIEVAAGLLEGHREVYDEACRRIDEICGSLLSLVSAVCSLKELSDRSKARVIATGEYLSSNIICFAMNVAGIRTNIVDARRMIITDDVCLRGEPDMEAIAEKVPEVIGGAFTPGVEAVITQGFVSSSADGIPTVLGRGGSDYTASLIGMAMDAAKIEIWTDVDGVHTSDPRKVSGTRSLRRISFEEAAEMAYFGAKVLHPLTIEPAVNKNIPIWVLDSIHPELPGTAILQDSLIEEGVKSISFKENIRMINIFSLKMINTYGFLDRVFDLFNEHRVSVDLISTSEANISLTVDSSQNIDHVVKELSEFAEVCVTDDKAQVSVIGKNVINIKGLFENIFGPLFSYKIYMISQGASAVNLSFVVDRNALVEVVNTLHKQLFG